MRYLMLTLLFPLIIKAQNPVSCEANGINLTGDVKIVEYNADINVYIDTLNTISPFEVELTEFPSRCGQWNIVEHNADFTIRVLEYEAGSDLIIRFKESRKSRALLNKLFK